MSTWMRQLKPHADPMPEPPVLSAFRHYCVSSAPSGNDSRTADAVVVRIDERRPEVEDLGRSRNRRQEPWCGFPECMPSPVGHRLVLDESRSRGEGARDMPPYGVAVASGGFDGMTRACAPGARWALGKPTLASVQSVRKSEQ